MVDKSISTSDSGAVKPNIENGKQPCVLLAEDDRSLRRLLQLMLERAGYRVIPAADGLEAMNLALSNPVDVVVTDAMMPKLSGDELCRRIRNTEKLSHLPLILLSALERKESRENPKLADAFLSKPVSGESLVACIKELLARRETAK
jgi:DNA-binding response OmpR family regulator